MRRRQSQDETGTMWNALPENSLAERHKRCRGGKNAKQRITEAFLLIPLVEKKPLS